MRHKLDNPQLIQSIDRHNVRHIISEFPAQVREAVTIGETYCRQIRTRPDIRTIVFSGMGGSAIGADILRELLKDTCPYPILVNRTYRLPYCVNKNTLLIVSSYSGNTEETIAALQEGIAKKAAIICIATDGRVAECAQAHNLALITIPAGLPPRHALAFLVFPLLIMFKQWDFIAESTVDRAETLEIIQNLRDNEIGCDVPYVQNYAKKIAAKIHRTFPIIYTYDKYFAPVALRWRGQLAENAKTLCSHHVLPEMNHNEIMGWQQFNKVVKQFSVIMLKDSGSGERLNKRMAITQHIIENIGVLVLEVSSKGTSILSRIISLVYSGDFVSFYLAILNKVDPIAIDAIDFLKQELAKEKT